MKTEILVTVVAALCGLGIGLVALTEGQAGTALVAGAGALVGFVALLAFVADHASRRPPDPKR